MFDEKLLWYVAIGLGCLAFVPDIPLTPSEKREYMEAKKVLPRLVIFFIESFAAVLIVTLWPIYLINLVCRKLD